MINPNPDQSGSPTIDVLTGMPTTNTAVIDSSLIDMPITINPPLTNISLGDVLNALVLVAPKPIHYSVEDYVIVIRSGKPSVPLPARIFKVDANRFIGALHMNTGMQTNSVSAIARIYFSTFGLDWDSPKGKSIFYNDRLGELFVRAMQSDLDLIERTLSQLNVGAEPVPTGPFPPSTRTNIQSTNASRPRIHIKARFLEVPKNGFIIDLRTSTNDSNSQMTGILNDENFRTVLRSLEAKPGYEVLAEPEVVTTSGRQNQMRATTLETEEDVVYDVVVKRPKRKRPRPADPGPFLDVVPYVLSDGYTIDLTIIASLKEITGYDRPTNSAFVTNSAGVKLGGNFTPL